MKADELLLQYIKSNHSDDLKALKDSNKQCKVNIDFTLLNHFFNTEINKDFFDFENYDILISNVEKTINEKRSKKNWISLKITDVPPNVELHDLDTSHNGDIISAKALIKNITKINAGVDTLVYECRGCMRLLSVPITNTNNITVPTLCTECGGKHFKPVYDLSTFKNYRYVKLEEPLELRTGGTSREFKGYMEDYLASPQHNLKAGDVVDIVGKFKVEKSNKNKNDNDFEFLIDLHNISPVNDAFEDYRLTDEDKQEIIKLSKQPNIFDRMVDNLMPEIVGYKSVKKGLLLQLFEGYRPRDDKFKSSFMDRWTIHILLIGDAGIGKSQIINALKKNAPKLISIAGTDTSQAGLTTSAVKDELTGSWTLEAGAIVLADTGLLCIDEFDKLSKKTQKSLNQPMEQLIVDSAKAGLVQTMTARTSVLACANPKYSRFTHLKDLKEQIDIPESTLSRFDLVFALTDDINERKDTEIATSLLNKSTLLEDIEIIPSELFKKYITYAKLEVFPVLTAEAKKTLIDFYVDTRQTALTDDTAKPITARDLKALERLTIARAKVELREDATVEDAECSIQIYTDALRTIGLTPNTAGAISKVMSNKEIQAVSDAENLIKARMELYDLASVDELILSDIKHEVNLMCYENDLNGEEILNMALRNVRKNTLSY